jgi:hypothetical protein
MKTFTTYNKLSGEIASIGFCPDDDLLSQETDALGVIEGNYEPEIYYAPAGVPTPKPEKPSGDHEWNETTKQWDFDKTKIKLRLYRHVDRERIKRDNLDIIYDGKNLQADDEARANIHGKIAEIVAAESISTTISPLIWRCSDNIIHTWTDMLIYKAWLQGLVMAIAARSTSLYQASWTHKAAIAALDTVQEIKDYDINTGW